MEKLKYMAKLTQPVDGRGGFPAWSSLPDPALGFMHATQLIASHTAMEHLLCTRYPTGHLIYLIGSKYHLYTDENLGRGV